MGRVSGVVLGKGTECLLGVTLWRAYGSAKSWSETWEIFVSLPELSQLGTIAAIAMILGLFWATTSALYAMISEVLKQADKKLANPAERGERDREATG